MLIFWPEDAAALASLTWPHFWPKPQKCAKVRLSPAPAYSLGFLKNASITDMCSPVAMPLLLHFSATTRQRRQWRFVRTLRFVPAEVERIRRRGRNGDPGALAQSASHGTVAAGVTGRPPPNSSKTPRMTGSMAWKTSSCSTKLISKSS